MCGSKVINNLVGAYRVVRVRLLHRANAFVWTTQTRFVERANAFVTRVRYTLHLSGTVHHFFHSTPSIVPGDLKLCIICSEWGTGAYSVVYMYM